MTALHTFFANYGAVIFDETLRHIYLTVVAVVAACVFAIPVGVALAHTKKQVVISLVLGSAGVLQTIPGLAMLAIIVMIFASMKLPTIGVPPALIALIFYAILPVLRNTYTGIKSVDPGLIDVGMGVGYTRWQILTKIEIPLAMPVIMAGIRIATVWTIGTATLCALIGAGGLGDLILKGLRSISFDYLAAGTVPAALLALVMDGLLAFAELYFTPGRIRRRRKDYSARTSLTWRGAIAIVAVLGAAVGLMLRNGFLGTSRRHYVAAFDSEFLVRQDGFPGLARLYQLHLHTRPLQMDSGLLYQAIKQKSVDIIDGFATDGRIKAYHLVALKDNVHFFPPYYAAPLVRESTLRRYPVVKTLLDRLSNRISDTTMRSMNYAVDNQGMPAAKVARKFLLLNHLIPSHVIPHRRRIGKIVIGGKSFTEQAVLGQIMAQLIADNTNLRVVTHLTLGGTIICFNALKSGDIDIYPEYTGTGLVDILKRKVIENPEEVYAIDRRVFRQRYHLLWLKPFGFNNTYTITVRGTTATKQHLTTISDLAHLIDEQNHTS